MRFKRHRIICRPKRKPSFYCIEGVKMPLIRSLKNMRMEITIFLCQMLSGINNCLQARCVFHQSCSALWVAHKKSFLAKKLTCWFLFRRVSTILIDIGQKCRPHRVNWHLLYIWGKCQKSGKIGHFWLHPLVCSDYGRVLLIWFLLHDDRRKYPKILSTETAEARCWVLKRNV